MGPTDTSLRQFMRLPQTYFRFPPGHVHGYRKDGRPIYAVAGGSEAAPEPSSNGSTITVPAAPPEPPPTTATNTTNQQNGQTFSAEDIEKARQQEKDKLYGRIQEMDERFKKLEEERQARISAEEKARKDAEEEAERVRQENLTFSQKLEETQKTWEQRLAEMQGQIAQRDALLDRERQYQALQEFRNRRLTEETDHIMPELHTWVAGADEAEIEASISRAKETTASILAQVTQAQQAQQAQALQMRQQARGTNVTAPPVGPMENQTGYETMTAEQIAAMDMATYAKNRARLLGAASQQMRGRG